MTSRIPMTQPSHPTFPTFLIGLCHSNCTLQVSLFFACGFAVLSCDRRPATVIETATEIGTPTETVTTETGTPTETVTTNLFGVEAEAAAGSAADPLAEAAAEAAVFEAF